MRIRRHSKISSFAPTGELESLSTATTRHRHRRIALELGIDVERPPTIVPRQIAPVGREELGIVEERRPDQLALPTMGNRTHRDLVLPGFEQVGVRMPTVAGETQLHADHLFGLHRRLRLVFFHAKDLHRLRDRTGPPTSSAPAPLQPSRHGSRKVPSHARPAIDWYAACP